MRFILGLLLGLVGGWALGSFLWAPIADRWRSAYDRVFETRQEIQLRGYDLGHMNVCYRDGEVGVWFLEDCDAP